MAIPAGVGLYADHFCARRALDVHALSHDWREKRHNQRKRADERAREKPTESVSPLPVGDEGRKSAEDESDYPESFHFETLSDRVMPSLRREGRTAVLPWA
jgi:hypothetical protein